MQAQRAGRAMRIQDEVKNLFESCPGEYMFPTTLTGKLNIEIACSHSYHAGAHLEKKKQKKHQPSANLYNPQK